MRNVFRTCGLLAVIFIGGCVAERVVWSPDGKRAAILGDDGLHICDVSGKLWPQVVPGVKEVKCVAWMPDSQQLVACHQKQYMTWPEVSQAHPDEAVAASKNIDAVRAELLAATQGWPTFLEDTKKKLHLSDEQLSLTLMCLRDKMSESLPPNMDQKDRESYAAVSIEEDLVQLFNINANTATAGSILYRRPHNHDGILSARVSPTGQVVLLSVDVSVSHEQAEPPQLLLVPTDGSGKICDLERGAWYPDWSPDGDYVVYIRTDEDKSKDKMVGILTRQQVTDGSHQFLVEGHWPAREDLAAMVFDPFLHVRTAKDGRIFFAAMEVSLPAAIKDVDTQPTIFCFDPGKQATLTRVVPHSAAQTVGDAAQYFELSPDGRYVSIPFGDGRVSVLDIATGEAQLVQSVKELNSDNDLKLMTVPTWRTPTELTFIRPVANSTAHEVVQYSVPDKKTTVISTDWPAAVGDWLVEKPMAETNPAATTSPAQK